MKKLLLILLSIFFIGCADRYLVLQALQSEGALAHYCSVDEPSNGYCSGLLVFIPETDTEYYDGQLIEVPTGKRVVHDGVYRYISRDNRSRTVPIVKFID
jgi:hypothetical protein